MSLADTAQSSALSPQKSSTWVISFGCSDSRACCYELYLLIGLEMLTLMMWKLYIVYPRWSIRSLVRNTPTIALHLENGSTPLNVDPLPRLSEDSDRSESLEDQSTISYEGADEKEASRLQVLWTNVMSEGTYQNSSLYEKVEVLLLCWAKSDMDTTNEVDDLRSVFENDFGYHTTTERLDANSKHGLQVEVNAIVAQFVRQHNGPNTLFIVYYAGHGRPGKFFGEVEFLAHMSPNDCRDTDLRERNRLVWNNAEDLLRPARADVLEILDCCYAGALARGENRHFELIAAAKDHGLTKVPGPESFTRALIYSLQKLVNGKPEGRFTTDELLRSITTDAPDFPNDQTPVMFDRDNKKPSPGHIILHPLRKDGKDGTAPQTPKAESPLKGAIGYMITLQFEFPEKPPDDHITTIGRNFNKVFEQNTLQVLRIRWGGIRANTFTRAAHHFQKKLRSRRASSQSQRPRDLAAITTASTPSIGVMNSGLLSPNAVTFDAQDSTGDESGSLFTASSPATPSDVELKTCTKDSLSLLDSAHAENFEETLNARLIEEKGTEGTCSTSVQGTAKGVARARSNHSLH
ncbi:MAG: hypothetical protein Q9166_001804 [cf. Caloplaca sp. 2 TL-2023]